MSKVVKIVGTGIGALVAWFGATRLLRRSSADAPASKPKAGGK